MRELSTFITPNFRPEVVGGRLDKHHITRFKLSRQTNKQDYTTLTVNALCFGPKKDNVLLTLEHAISKADNILIFYYEDMHVRWSYVNHNKESYFIYKKNDVECYKIKPTYLYIRGCYVEPDDEYWLLLGDFYTFVDMWDGPVLCPPKKQMPNESKLFQLNNSLKKAVSHLKSISLGKSYVIKGSARLNSLNNNTSYIVKSLSGVRSIVVDENDFNKWDVKNMNHVPVLFQEKVEGNDLRIHIINKKLFGKRSHIKDSIDYRYDKHFFKLTVANDLDDELKALCTLISIEEDNQLLGIDFIQTDTGHVVLEANPSPGWSAYHPYNGIDDEPFIIALLKVLKSA